MQNLINPILNNTLTAETGFNGPVGCVAVSMAQIMAIGFEQGQGVILILKMI